MHADGPKSFFIHFLLRSTTVAITMLILIFVCFSDLDIWVEDRVFYPLLPVQGKNIFPFKSGIQVTCAPERIELPYKYVAENNAVEKHTYSYG